MALFAITCLLSLAASGQAEGRVTGIRYQHPAIPETRIACGSEAALGYTAKVEPGRCELLGRVEFAGYLAGASSENEADGSFARLVIRSASAGGVEWPQGWGVGDAWGWPILNARTRSKMSLHAFRRVRCADRSVWYSRVDIVNQENAYDLRMVLPVCDEPLSAVPVPDPSNW